MSCFISFSFSVCWVILVIPQTALTIFLTALGNAFGMGYLESKPLIRLFSPKIRIVEFIN